MNFDSFPFVIGWELTLGCNLRCKHCASSAGSLRYKELTLKESLAICDQFPEILVDEVIFTGGEPLLNTNWSQIASHLTKLGIKCGMVTNGIPVTDDIIKTMHDSGINAVGLSLDGPEFIHDQIRGQSGSFKKTANAIEKLIQAGTCVTIITSVTGININHLDEMYHLVRSLGAWKWQLQPLFPIGRGRENDYLYLTNEHFLSLGKYIHDLRPIAKKAGLEVVPADSCGFFSPLDFEEFGWQGCGAGRFSCGIMSDGRIKGCLSWPDTTVEGDLRKDDLWTIWFRNGAFKNLREYNKEDLGGKCKSCDVALECGGGCQAMSLAATGNWRSDPFCYRQIIKELAVEEISV